MNLQIIGITTEYNPFHNGHKWQLQAIREKFGNVPVIACMSGFFVQRGEIALTDPWSRAAAAVHAGADLVLLLPSWYSLRSADYFAAGAVKTLAATGLVNTLVCGTEQDAGHNLAETAAWSLQAETEQQIKTLLQKGLSYGAAWETAAMQKHKDANWFKGANNLLALAYQKVVIQNNLSFELITLPRQGSNYNDTVLTPPYASASAIRTALRNNGASVSLSSVMPEDSLALLKPNETNYAARFVQQEETLALLLGSLLARCNSHDLYEHSSGSRELCDRFHNGKSELQQGYRSFCRSITSKRNPLPSVRRLALQLLLHKGRAFWTETPEPAYLRVLAFNNRGRNLLKKMKETAKLPVVTKPGRIEHYKNTALYPLFQLDADAADLYQLLNGNIGIYGTCFTTSPLYVK
ncbi:nucleotidyltransferase family protein [Succiniclasticum ruminis]|uniref:tRNA(Met) cytidine acetate ligase n=1 Tax=Succiniclasticum ruminis DSM 9236 TaxID=1123323 RepID=A0A1I1ZNM0_9FIRM|nr:nucleotidyltransferase family protein [Succiniclasticum ruminis]SFE33317.1 Predicted nucleotidyltransferase [Succiniclasticum ruminis DSM 9236]